MRKIKMAILLGVAICFSVSNMNAQVLKWAKSYDGTQGYDDNSYAVTIDASGNVYVTGESNMCPNGDEAIVTRKYNSSGTMQWSTPYNGGYNNCDPNANGADKEFGGAIAVDAQGNVWVTGVTYTGTTYYDDLCLIKYSSAGAILWIKTYHDYSSGHVPKGTCIAIVNTSGSGTDVYVGGETYDVTNGYKGIVLKSDATYNSGLWGWSNTPYLFGNSSITTDQTATDIKVDASNAYVYVTGYTYSSTTSQDCFTSKLSASTGVPQSGWPKTYNNSSYNLSDESNAMILDASSNVYIAGYRTTSTDKDALVIKYNSSGTQQWLSSWSNPNYNNGSDVYRDIAGFGAYGASSHDLFAGGYTQQASRYNTDYLLSAINTDNGSFATIWATNPVTYDGSGTSSEPAGTDEGWSVDYESTLNVVYITGMAWENTPSPDNINITNLGYSAANGTQVWRTTYDYGTDRILIGPDEVYNKYALITKYNSSLCQPFDEIYVTGASYINHSGTYDFDYITLKYGCSSCLGCGPIGGRLANTEKPEVTGFYPNPFNTSAVLKLPAGTEINNAVLTVYDVAGRLVTRVNNITSTEIVINKGDMHNGMYFYKLTDNGNILSNGKFIITE